MTPPLTPPDCDLRDFGFMPLEVVRLRDSDLANLATGEEFKAAVLLWCVAWHQVPAASLPSDDRLLARYSGSGSAWKKVKTAALRGFVECEDGRLYHPVIAEKALEAIESKRKQRERTKHATEAREQRRREEQLARDVDALARRDVIRDVERDVLRNVERNVVQGTVKGQGREKKGKTADFVGMPGFERFWQAWPSHPRKVDKRNCESRWRAEGCEAIADRIVADVEARKRSPDWTKQAGEFIPGPAVYLNQRRWEAPVSLPFSAPDERKVAL